jgi:thiol:disulfide interchange protein DsbD
MVVAFLALVFGVLAASLFGAFEFALPAGLGNRLSRVGGGGYKGAFGLGLVCGIVAAPCVGPFLFGLLGFIATTRDVLIGSLAMAAYGLGLGTLFFAVGTFAVGLPKPGAWMLGVKWAAGVTLAVIAVRYVHTALPTPARELLRPGGAAMPVGIGALVLGLALAGAHVASEQRGSRIARHSRVFHASSIAPGILGLFVVVGYLENPRRASSPASVSGAAADLHWESDESVAVARASSQHRPLLVDFGAEWCASCHELDRTTFVDERVREEGARFVALRIDATNDDDPDVASLRRKYGATAGLPVIVLIASNGNEAARFTEFVPPDRFVAALRTIQ